MSGGEPLQLSASGRQQLHLALILGREKRGGNTGSAARVRAGLHWKIVSGFAEEIRALPVLEEVDRANLSVAEEYLRWLEGNTPSRYQELPTFQESSVCIFPSNRTRAVPEEATVPETPAPAWFLGENRSRAVPEEAPEPSSSAYPSPDRASESFLSR